MDVGKVEGAQINGTSLFLPEFRTQWDKQKIDADKGQNVHFISDES